MTEPTEQTCPNCEGSGEVACDYCSSEGHTPVHLTTPYGFAPYTHKRCKKCHGSKTMRCPVCKGKKVVPI